MWSALEAALPERWTPWRVINGPNPLCNGDVWYSIKETKLGEPIQSNRSYRFFFYFLELILLFTFEIFHWFSRVEHNWLDRGFKFALSSVNIVTSATRTTSKMSTTTVVVVAATTTTVITMTTNAPATTATNPAVPRWPNG